jgi:hypothetical protein
MGHKVLTRLPDIGEMFECLLKQESFMPAALSQWRPGDKLEVIAHVNMQGSINAVFWNHRDMTASTLRDDLYRPIRTPEQIAAEQREKVVQEMVNDCPYPGSATTAIDCLALYKAGYRKFEIVPE